MSVRKFTEFLKSIVFESHPSSSTPHPQQISNKFCRKSDIWDQTRLLPFASPPLHQYRFPTGFCFQKRFCPLPDRQQKNQPLLLRSCRKSRGWSFTSLLLWKMVSDIAVFGYQTQYLPVLILVVMENSV